MPDAYEIHDAQFIQLLTVTSAADAIVVSLPVVPAGKVWTVLSARVTCSAVETQTYWWSVWNNGFYFPVTVPVSATITPAAWRFFGFVNEGMEFKVFAGEGLSAHRAAATAASTITIMARILENDIQFYREIDKHKELRRKQESPLQFFRRAAAGGGGSRTGLREPTGREGRTER